MTSYSSNLELSKFIDNYDSNSEKIISFSPSESENKPIDNNFEFRQLVIQEVIQTPENAPLELLWDLFEAETLFAKTNFSVNPNLRHLASILLIRGGTKYLQKFLRYRYLSFDIYCETAQIKIPQELSLQLALECENNSKSANDKSEKELWEGGIKFFQWKNESS
ncbi:MAG: hypothetical protein AAF378_08200 [Cyanobacteria bacterium P01_A01_bin.84]